MIVYEITAKVNPDLIEKFEKYMLEQHIPEILETGFFNGAKFTRSGKDLYRIQYEAHNQKALDEYLEKDAPRLREDFLLNFSEGIEISRENWEVLRIF